MQASAHVQAAIEILAQWQLGEQPLAVLSKAWARGHRFAGSKDRAAISDIVYQALRDGDAAGLVFLDTSGDPSADPRADPSAAAAGTETSASARAMVLGSLALSGNSCAEMDALCEGPHAPAAITDQERQALLRVNLRSQVNASASVPAWLWPSWQQQFGVDANTAAESMRQRAPLDLRVNSLLAEQQTLAELTALGLHRFPHSDAADSDSHAAGCYRYDAPGKLPNFQQHPRYLAGEFEVQDYSSQLAVQLCAARPGMRILDLCAGAGGKSLALASALQNQAQIYSFDVSPAQQADLPARLARAGAHSIQMLPPGDPRALTRSGTFDRVLVDAPCTGSGTWRRHPDAKGRLKPHHLQTRIEQQRRALRQAADRVRPGGWLVYLTCSMLPEENQAQMHWALSQFGEFSEVPWQTIVAEHAQKSTELQSLAKLGSATKLSGPGLLLAPHLHACDGFYFCALQKAPN